MLDGTTWTFMSGSNISGQLGNYGTKGVASLSNVPGGRSASCIAKISNALWIFGGFGYAAPSSSGPLNDLWKYELPPLTTEFASTTSAISSGIQLSYSFTFLVISFFLL